MTKNSGFKLFLPILSISWCSIAILDALTGNYFQLSYIRASWASMTVVTSSLFILLFVVDFFKSKQLRINCYYLLLGLSIIDAIVGLIWDSREYISSFSTALFFGLMAVHGLLLENNRYRIFSFLLKTFVYYVSGGIIILYFYDSSHVYSMPGFETMSWNTAAGFMLFTATHLPYHFDYLLEKKEVSATFKYFGKHVLELWIYVSFILPIFVIVSITTLHFLEYLNSDESISIILLLLIILPFPLTYYLFNDAVRWNKALSEREDIITEKEEELMYFNNLLTEFAQITSHNLRGPAVSMVNLIDILNDDSAPDTVRQQGLKLLTDKIHSYKYTVDNLTEFYRMIRKRGVEHKACNLKDYINQAVISAIGDDYYPIPDYELELNLEVEEVIYPSIYLENMFYNLISNSFKYSKNGNTLIISISSSNKNKNKNITEIKVRDNGIGMDLEFFKDKIFQFGRTYHNFAYSRGIGLFVVKSQLTRMGDNITVDSKEGQYTEFTITLTNHYEKELDYN